MTRARFAFAAALVSVSLVGVTAFAQSQPPKAPDFKPILGGKKFVPPVKGQADVDFTKPVTKRVKDNVVTSIEVKNISTAPIARLTIDETWYGKDGSIVAGGKGVINGMLQPGEVQTVTIETPYNSKMNSNNYNFSHANGTVKPHRVDKVVAGNATGGEKEPAEKTASASKTAKKK